MKRGIVFILSILIVFQSGCTWSSDKKNEIIALENEYTLQYNKLGQNDYFSNPTNLTAIGSYIWFLGEKNAQPYVCRISMNNDKLYEIPLHFRNESQVNCIAFSETKICYSTIQEIKDADTNNVVYDSWIYCISNDGQECFSIHVNQFLEKENDLPIITSICFSEDGEIFLTTSSTLYLFNAKGSIQKEHIIEGHNYNVIKSQLGDIYIYDWDTLKILSFNVETLQVGAMVFDCYDFQKIYPCGSNDFYGVSDDGVYSISIAEQTNKCIFPEGMTAGIQFVFPIDDETWLVSHMDYILNETTLYTAVQIQAGQIPEKETLTIAVQDENAIDTFFSLAIKQFNFDNQECEIHVKTYTDEMLIAALALNDAPDMILFDTTGCWEKLNPQLLQKTGILMDLYTVMEQDRSFSKDEILPNILAVNEYHDSLYLIPFTFQFRTIYTDSRYGGIRNWTLDDLIYAAETLPNDVSIADYSRNDFLLSVIQWCLPLFVDSETNSCDFNRSIFYNLLDLCKNGFVDGSSETTKYSSEYLINFLFSTFDLTTLCTGLEVLDESKIITGFPNAEGGQFTFYSLLGITTHCRDVNAAWSFIKMLLKSVNATSQPSILLKDFLDSADRMRLTYSDSLVNQMVDLVLETKMATEIYSPIPQIVVEEASAYFSGDKTAEQVVKYINNRVNIFLAEQN